MSEQWIRVCYQPRLARFGFLPDKAYYVGQDDEILKIKKGQKINVTGVIYDIGDRTFNTHNNSNMASKVIKMDHGVIR